MISLSNEAIRDCDNVILFESIEVAITELFSILAWLFTFGMAEGGGNNIHTLGISIKFDPIQILNSGESTTAHIFRKLKVQSRANILILLQLNIL